MKFSKKRIENNLLIVSNNKKNDLKINDIIIINNTDVGYVVKILSDEIWLFINDIQHSEINVDIQKSTSLSNDRSIFGKAINVLGDDIFALNKKTPKVKEKNTKANKNNASVNLSFQPFDISKRRSLIEQLDTGVPLIDTFLPISLGQKMLIMGNKNSGKTSIAKNIIKNQLHNDIKIIYVAIGQTAKEIIQTVQEFEDIGIMNRVSIQAALPEQKVEQFILPTVATSHARNIAIKGEKVLVIFDELTNHANIKREISISQNKTLGRESLPPDIFYTYAHILENGGEFVNGGSITMIPIINSLSNSLLGSLESSVMAITDGQIVTSHEIAKKGEYPGIDISLSVSRVGSQVQSPIASDLSKFTRDIYNDYNNLMISFKGRKVDELPPGIAKQILSGQCIHNIFYKEYFEYFDWNLFHLFKNFIEYEWYNILLSKYSKEIIRFVIYLYLFDKKIQKYSNKINSMGKKYKDIPKYYTERISSYIAILINKFIKNKYNETVIEDNILISSYLSSEMINEFNEFMKEVSNKYDNNFKNAISKKIIENNKKKSDIKNKDIKKDNIKKTVPAKKTAAKKAPAKKKAAPKKAAPKKAAPKKAAPKKAAPKKAVPAKNNKVTQKELTGINWWFQIEEKENG